MEERFSGETDNGRRKNGKEILVFFPAQKDFILPKEVKKEGGKKPSPSAPS